MSERNARTLVDFFEETTTRLPEQPGFLTKIDGVWRPTTYREFRKDVYRLARWLLSQGVSHGDRVGVLSHNRKEWAVADMAILSVGGVNVPIYPTLEPQQVKALIKHSGSVIVFVENQQQLEKLGADVTDLPDLRKIVTFTPTTAKENLPVLSLQTAMGPEELTAEEIDKVRVRSKRLTSDDLSSIVYTSGTTGIPKGVMLTHGNFASNVEAVKMIVRIDETDSCLSFLPLSHVLERMAGYYLMLSSGVTIAYAESVETVAQNLVEVKPTLVISVPRLYEKMYDRVQKTIAEGPPIKRTLFNWALSVGRERDQLARQGRKSTINDISFRVANLLVLNKIKDKVGGRLRFFVSGGAPLEKKIGEFFASAGVLILEGYGLTETSPVTNVNRPDSYRFGTVGPAIPGVDVRIADDGEIEIRGPNVMRGYYKMPEETREVLSDDGWFKTGDIGVIDPDGHLRITDRKKELIVTSGGKNVAPAPIENLFKTSPYIMQIMCVGDRRKFIGALIVPDWERVKSKLDAKLQQMSAEQLTSAPEVIKVIKDEVENLNQELPRYERIKSFVLLANEWTQESGQLTPTLKLKRRIIHNDFAAEIERIYTTASEE